MINEKSHALPHVQSTNFKKKEQEKKNGKRGRNGETKRSGLQSGWWGLGTL